MMVLLLFQKSMTCTREMKVVLHGCRGVSISIYMCASDVEIM